MTPTTSSRACIRVDSSRTNYNGGVRSTGFSTGVAKKELVIANLMVEKAAKLDRDAFGVAVGQGRRGSHRQAVERLGGEAQTPRLVGACERQVRVFLWGALRCFAASESPFPKKKTGCRRWCV
jgi:hypothetical protein